MAKRDILPNPMFTPAEIAKQWGISADKVIEWIKSGELRAVNMATDLNSRPRYKISQTHIDDFMARRAALTPKKKPERRRRLRLKEGGQYF